MSFNNPFLIQSWQRKKEEETFKQERAVNIYLDTKLEAEKYPNLNEIFERMEHSVIRYGKSINMLAIVARSENKDKRMLEEIDRNRRLAHNALIDELNLLSRQFRNIGIDNEWRKEIGLDSKTVGGWAYKVAEFISSDILKENNYEN